MITTTLGDMDETTLVKSEGIIDNDNEITSWVEYRQHNSNEIIHRSVHVSLKEAISSNMPLGQLQ